MGAYQDPQEKETPPGTPFDDGFTPSTTKGYTSADLTGGFHAENFFIPLYTESQETDHTNVNTNQQPPTPAATLDKEMAVAAAAATAEAKASATAKATEMEAADAVEAEAVAADVAKFIARMESRSRSGNSRGGSS
jgi:hypothetical protein